MKRKILEKILINGLMTYNNFYVKIYYLNLYLINQYSFFDAFVFLRNFYVWSQVYEKLLTNIKKRRIL